MKVTFIQIGKTSQNFVSEGVEEFRRRLKRYISFKIKTVPELKNTRKLSINQIKLREGEALVKVLDSSDYLVLLDERGKEYTSKQFSLFLEKIMISGRVKNMVFLCGGAYGFSEKVYKRANKKISLSKMTFSHQLIRIIFMEQLYRAMTIIKDDPYHHA
jgi:23S rRNA (pseudouridine1915-N3)-methyltransferase